MAGFFVITVEVMAGPLTPLTAAEAWRFFPGTCLQMRLLEIRGRLTGQRIGLSTTVGDHYLVVSQKQHKASL